MERVNLKKLNEVDCKEQYCVEISNRFAVLENLDTEMTLTELGKLLEYKNFCQRESGLL
jgi:hypothetical protein